MKRISLLSFFILQCYCILAKCDKENITQSTVLVVLLARNKENTLPYFLTMFENFNYPKEKISLFIRSDHNQDRTIEILETWLNVHEQEYHSVDTLFDESLALYFEEFDGVLFGKERIRNIINFKEKSLEKAKTVGADYAWFLDLDVFLVDPDILQKLINKNKPIVAPMLKSATTHSNFWCGMTEDMWYARTDEYGPILYQEKTGCFPVTLVNECVLVDLKTNESQSLTFDPLKIQNYNGPYVDTIAFAFAAQKGNIEVSICNEEEFGYILEPLNKNDDFTKDFMNLSELKIRMELLHGPFIVSEQLSKFVDPLPEVDNLGFDQIYVINLSRRHDRKQRMISLLREQGLEGKHFEAFDWRDLNSTYLENIGVQPLQAFDDGQMTYGTIANFLSHSSIWRDIIEKDFGKVIIFEDDFQFKYYFRMDVENMMNEIEELNLSWDLIYLERNERQPWDVTEVENSNYLVYPSFSWSAAGYILSLEGAKKLLKPNPVSKMLPTDVYLPVMFDKCPEEEWKKPFNPRDLKAFSIDPLVGNQYHYGYQNGYISDTVHAPEIGDVEFEESEEFLGGKTQLPIILQDTWVTQIFDYSMNSVCRSIDVFIRS